MDNGTWGAEIWTGTMKVSSPYTTSGSYYCNASHQTVSLHGSF